MPLRIKQPLASPNIECIHLFQTNSVHKSKAMDQGPRLLLHKPFISARFVIPQMIMLRTSCVLLSSSHFLSSTAATFGSFICLLITYVLAAVVASVAAVVGVFVGLTTESGAIRGAVIGAVSGAIYAAQAFKSSLAVWHSHESKVWDFQYVIGIVSGVLSKKLLMEMSVFSLQSAIQNEMSAAESSFIATIDALETCYARGMTRESVENFPKISITSQNGLDDKGYGISCVVCLQDFGVGEIVRCLPNCHHKFHMPCIDAWIMKHGSCPLCRRHFVNFNSFCD